MAALAVEPIFACLAAGEISPHVALVRLLAAFGGVSEIEREVERAVAAEPGRAGVAELARLLREHRQGCERVAALLAAHPGPDSGPPEEALAACRRFFDRAALEDEATSVALYSLGDPEVLARATREVVQALERWGLLGPGRDALEIGCGTGRMLAALAPLLREVHGTDLSPAMVAAARRRCAGLGNVRLAEASGRDLAPFADRSLDLVLAVDSFPYLHAAGPAVVEAHFREAARVLRPGGDLAILNYSYRGDPAADGEEFARLSAAHGFAVLAAAERPFRLWDGAAFRARREGEDRVVYSGSIGGST